MRETQSPANREVLSDDTSAPAQLELLVSSSTGVQTFQVSRDTTYVIGRAPECQITIQDPSISREHAALHVGATTHLQDLGSRNGTRVGGRAIGTDPVDLMPGDAFELGSATLVLQAKRAAVQRHTTFPPPAAEGHLATRVGQPRIIASSRPVVRDPEMRRLYQLLRDVAPSPITVLILGETGVGKEVFAERIHLESGVQGEFLQLNCAALPESILEGELFGYERGAFTGAAQGKVGLFESASGGTLFLDEIGELPLGVQVKLLRFLESGEILKLGSVRTKRVQVRVIAATNRNLRQDVNTGRFRADLYFRLDGVTVTIPPLRQRVDDIEPLAEYFIRGMAGRVGRAPPLLNPATLEMLKAHSWPGNVRELRNAIERAMVLCRDKELLPQHVALHVPMVSYSLGEDFATAMTGQFPVLPEFAEEPPPPATSGSAPNARSTGTVRPPPLQEEMRAMEKERVLEALARAAGNQSLAARMLGISRSTLISRIEVYGIARPRKR